MYRKILLLLSFCFLVVPVLAQDKNTPVSRLTITCDDGTSFNNGVEIRVVHMQAGRTYTATAVGLDGFDPILAVIDSETHTGLCSGDEPDASLYAADLPSTGSVSASEHSSQIVFHQGTSEEFADISLVVGGTNNTGGEFLVFLEGMDVTGDDGAGDIFSVNVTPAMVSSGVPVTTYMMTAIDSKLDPLIYQTSGGPSTDVLTDSDDHPIYCDDAGSADTCYDVGTGLGSYSVTMGAAQLPGWEYDAMLTARIKDVTLSQDRENNYITYFMTSYQNKTEGQYLLVFHIGIA